MTYIKSLYPNHTAQAVCQALKYLKNHVRVSQVLRKSLIMSHEMSIYVSIKSLGEKKDGGSPCMRLSGMSSAVTLDIPAGHQHEHLGLHFPVSLPCSTLPLGMQEGRVKILTLWSQTHTFWPPVWHH